MRLIAILGLAAGLLLTATGCATPTRSGEESAAAAMQAWEMDLLQLSDDWNTFWLVDRPSRLTDSYTY